jgi:hypothetical protein
VPIKHDDDDGLGRWVNKQRAIYAKGALTRDRIARLEAIPVWTWNARKVRQDEAHAGMPSVG